MTPIEWLLAVFWALMWIGVVVVLYFAQKLLMKLFMGG